MRDFLKIVFYILRAIAIPVAFGLLLFAEWWVSIIFIIVAAFVLFIAGMFT